MEAKHGCSDDFAKRQMEAKRREEEDDTNHFTYRVKEMEEDKELRSTTPTKRRCRRQVLLSTPSVKKHKSV